MTEKITHTHTHTHRPILLTLKLDSLIRVIVQNFVPLTILLFRYMENISWYSLIAQLVKNLPAMQETPVPFLHREDLLEKGQATHSSALLFLGFPCGSAGKEFACNAGDLGSSSGLGIPWRRERLPLHYSRLRIPQTVCSMVHGESGTTERLSLSQNISYCSSYEILTVLTNNNKLTDILISHTFPKYPLLWE